MTLFKKTVSSIAALALMAGVVPGTVSTASAWETGQLREKPKPGPIIIIFMVLVGAGIFALASSGGDDRPTSP